MKFIHVHPGDAVDLRNQIERQNMMWIKKGVKTCNEFFF